MLLPQFLGFLHILTHSLFHLASSICFPIFQILVSQSINQIFIILFSLPFFLFCLFLFNSGMFSHKSFFFCLGNLGMVSYVLANEDMITLSDFSMLFWSRIKEINLDSQNSNLTHSFLRA